MIMRSQSLLLSNEPLNEGLQRHIATSDFETIIAYQYPLREGQELARKLLRELRKLQHTPQRFNASYQYMAESITKRSKVKGVVIVESNVDPMWLRESSSGKIYTLSNPSGLERTMQSFAAWSHQMNDFVLPTVDAFMTISGAR